MGSETVSNGHIKERVCPSPMYKNITSYGLPSKTSVVVSPVSVQTNKMGKEKKNKLKRNVHLT
ncbi:hypothetical protein JHK82_046139 [Glycine max]|uniref:Uncharacterized protein n=2 Tax=Glycine subgen. Soja TaxID=1462606 RepID=A0A0R0FLR8_SOYBN|nr:hypothetical protein JHK85_045068 [Glycine max]KAG5101087.1 hypothetical protein JHK82_046139 [Glycine max]KAG5107674.1 hypothetical protein JHK84_044581 [Glycine max]RZB59717.1 hypothetical protein D0Y65_042785 [Glycine soja]